MNRKTRLALTSALTLASLLPSPPTARADVTSTSACGHPTVTREAEATAGYYVWFRFNANQRYTILGPYSLDDAYSVLEKVQDRGGFGFVVDHP
jgi:hypothetical protein